MTNSEDEDGITRARQTDGTERPRNSREIRFSVRGERSVNVV